jgi:hypothetical protein
VVFNTAFAQLPIGAWKMHLAYNNTTKVEQTPNRIFAVSDGALYSVGKENFDIETYDKISGLNDANILQIKYDETTKQLIIVYANGNIDLLGAKGVVNIPDLYIKQMSASKTVNHIFCNAGKAYLSTDFGILVLDLNRAEIKDTYYIGANSSAVKVLATTIFDGKLYAASASTIYSASLTSNLVDYQHWSTAGTYTGSGNFQSVASLAGNLFVLRNGKLYYSDGTNWTEPSIPQTIKAIKAADNNIYVVWANSAGRFDQTMNFSAAHLGTNEAIGDYVFESQNRKNWYAALDKGIATNLPNDEDQILAQYSPEGPATNAAWDMTFAGEKLFIVAGGRASNNYNNPGNISIYENDKWNNITHKYILEQTNNKQLRDFMNVAVDPKDNSHFFVTSYGSGLYEFRNNEFYERWNQENTDGIIWGTPNLDYDNYTRLAGAIFDKDGNLFFESANESASVKMLLTDGTWAELEYANGMFSRPGQMAINALYPNQKWALTGMANLLVFDDNGTLLDQSDDKSKMFTSFNYIKNGEIESTTNVGQHYCFAQDENGVIWIGTDKGPLLFNNTNNIFNSNYLCSKVLIPRNDGTGYGDFLLDEVPVKSIVIDGANRKWIGTGISGVYLVSADGLETIEHFTAENSPLPSNDVQSIAINKRTGEVFFGTTTGIASYQSNAAEPQPAFTKENIRAYPNPVRANYEGVITITGLMQNSIVKITDVAGHLIYQTTSNGSLATWNGRDASGNKVGTGVYVAMCISEDGALHGTTKIMIFR